MTVDSGRENKQLLVFGRSGCYKKMRFSQRLSADHLVLELREDED